MKRSVYLTVVLTFCIGAISLAGIPRMMNYQGRLTTPTGNVVADGIYSLNFSIYPASLGGTSLWTSGFMPTQVTDGLFSVILGSTVPLPDSLVKYDSLWLGITINLDPEITPRTRLNSSLYAMRSLVSTTADTSKHSLDRTVSASELVTGTLSTDRFSAHADLVSENKVGNGADQVAAGDHTHLISGVHYIQDAGWYEFNLTPAMGDVLLDSLVIPGGEIGNWMRITVAGYSNGPGAQMDLYVNGSLLGGKSISSVTFYGLEFKRWGNGIDYLYTPDPVQGYAYNIYIDTAQPVVLTLKAKATSGNPIGGAGRLLVEYIPL